MFDNKSLNNLQGSVRLKNRQARYVKQHHPWVYSNELAKIDTSIVPGSWVSLEDPDGKAIGYGYFNPRSLIAYRGFERVPFRDFDQTRALTFVRLDHALRTRNRAFASRITSNEQGRYSFRLSFGESDGLPGLVVDLYEASVKTGTKAMAVVQCHSAGADQFIFWVQQWLEERMGISCGVVRNDLDVRKREEAKQEVVPWGATPENVFCLEGGVRFSVDPFAGQKTGFFYDHRDNRAEVARLAATFDAPRVLDCFSYLGSWGLQALKRNAKATLLAVDVSQSALDRLLFNAKENGMSDRVEVLKTDFFKEKNFLGSKRFDVVISDPPALTSSAKQAAEGKRALQQCFDAAIAKLAPNGIAALASCSFHLTWDEFLVCVARAGSTNGQTLKVTHLGAQSADHPVLSTLLETRYLKSAIVEALS